jgi:hypothetical protein
MRSAIISVIGSLCVLLTPACQWSSDSPSGLTSLIRVQGGQAMRGSIAGPPSTIAAMATLFPRNEVIYPGVSNKSLTGNVGPDANAVALGVAGDDAYWLVPALTPDTSSDLTDYFTFATSLSLSPDLAGSPLLQSNPDSGTSTLFLSSRAVDNSGNFGKATLQPLIMYALGPAGTLVVALDWDAPVDLDLHVQTPILAPNDAGLVTVWAKERSAEPYNPDAGPDGVLDFDSNEDCQIDGRDRENVVWTGQPPAGHYIVRVDAFSLCGQTSAAWHAIAYTPQGTLGEASGVLTDAATREAPTAGAGLTAFEFNYP